MKTEDESSERLLKELKELGVVTEETPTGPTRPGKAARLIVHHDVFDANFTAAWTCILKWEWLQVFTSVCFS